MRVNVYTEELLAMGADAVEVVTAEYVNSRTKLPMKNYGLRIYLKSHPDLHCIPPRDDDRTAVTFWCGSKQENILKFIEMLDVEARHGISKIWRDKVEKAQTEAEAKL